MKKRVLLSMLGIVFVGILIAVNTNKSVNLLSSNGFILENAIALANNECGDGKVSGSPLSGTCNTPMSSDGKRKCTTSIITCQGSTNCCERKSCSLH
jgi:hypothetical protein